MDVLHTSFFYIIFINFNRLVSPRHKSVYPVLALIWMLYSQPLLNFFNNLIIPKPLTLNGISEGSTEGEIWGSKISAVRRVRKNIPSHFCDCFLYFPTCVWLCIVTLNDNFSNIFVRLNSPEMLLLGFKSLTVQIWVNDLTNGQMSSKITPSASPESGHGLPCRMGSLKLFLPIRIWMKPFQRLSFCLRFHCQWWSLT